ETTLSRNTIEDSDGHDFTLKLVDLSKDVRDTVSVKVFEPGLPTAALIVLGIVVLIGAMALDAWRPRGSGDGLMATITASVLFAVIT
ncbi:hypothetical protein Q8G50_32260, partial [Klebsiella pneumoniae]